MDPLTGQVFPVIKFAGVLRRLGQIEPPPHPDPASIGGRLRGIKEKDLNFPGGLEKFFFINQILALKHKGINPPPALFFKERQGIDLSLQADPALFFSRDGSRKIKNMVGGKREDLANAKYPDGGDGRQKKRQKKTSPPQEPEKGKKKDRNQKEERVRERKKPAEENPDREADGGPKKRPSHQPLNSRIPPSSCTKGTVPTGDCPLCIVRGWEKAAFERTRQNPAFAKRKIRRKKKTLS